MKDFNALIRDTLPSKNPIGTWQQGKNMLLTKGYKSIANEDGFKFQYLIEGTVIGVIATTKDVVYFSKNADGTDEIGVVNTDNDTPTYVTIIKSTLFNFKYNCPIEGIFIYNYKKELIVAWCDGVKDDSNTPKVLNLTNLPLELNTDGTVVDNKEFDKISMFPNTTEATIDTTYTTSGNIEGLVAYITYAYVFEDDTATAYFSISTLAYLGIYEVGKTSVNKKGVNLAFSNLDENFNKIKLGVVIKNEGVLVGYESYSINYNGTSLDFDFTNLSNFTTTSVEDIVLASSVFTKVNTMTKQNQQVMLGNVVTSPNIDFQKYANLLQLKPFKHFPTLEDNQLPGLLPDEVYSIYIELERLDGTWTDAFHIPGRVAEGSELDVLTTTQIETYKLEWAEESDEDYKQFHFYNNGAISDVSLFNKMGYWENDEVYPNDEHYNSTVDYKNQSLGGADLRGTPIRYHRLPSIRNMYAQGERGFAGESESSDGFLRLGIELTNFADIIPTEVLSQIQGYRLSFVRRDSSNSYVAGNYYLARRGTITRSVEVARYDWEFTDFRKNDTNATDVDTDINFSKGRLFGVELFKYRPTLDLTYIRANYLQKIQPRGNYIPLVVSADSSLVEDKYQFGKIAAPVTYTKENNLAANTSYCDEGISVEVDYDNNEGDGTNDFKYIHLTNGTEAVENLMLNCTAFYHKTNLYSGFKSNTLVVLGRTRQLTNFTQFKGGDVFNESSFQSNLFYCETDESGTTSTSNRIVQKSVGFFIKGLYSPSNCIVINKSNIMDADSVTTFQPLVMYDADDIDAVQTDRLILREYAFKILGDDDLSDILDINTILTFDYNTPYINRFPSRIQKGIKIPNENLTTKSLRTFLTESYYEMPNDKGEIIALRGKARSLFIQHRFTLFVASIKDKLSTPSGEDAYLGETDLFDRDPTELLSDDKGYVGSTSKFACLVVKGIYVVVNQVTGQIFTVQEGIEEITKSGNKNWFWNNWDNGLDFYELDVDGEKRRIDNPYVSVGHIVGYDREYDRLLFTKKLYKYIGTDENVVFDGEFYTLNDVKLEFSNTNYFTNLSKTLSYYLDTKSWGFEHDYYPNLTYYTSTGLFSLVNQLNGSSKANIYKHNDKLSKGLYYGQKFPSYVDLIFNSNLEVSKLYKSINWITDTINSNGGNDRFKTITHIAVYNNNQCSGIINLKDNHYDLTRNVQDEWNFNEFRDLVINPSNPILKDNGDIDESNLNKVKLWFDKSNFISKFIIVRLIIDNELNDSVYIHEVKVNSVISKR